MKRDRLLTLVALFVLSAVIIVSGGASFARAEDLLQAETSVVKPARKTTKKASPAETSYTKELLAALDSSGASPHELKTWIGAIPGSALRHLPEWEPEKQTRTGLLATYIMSENRNLGLKTAWREAAAFVHYGGKYDVPLDLLVAVANTESHFKPTARSGYGACGIMQVVWRIHSSLMQANGILTQEDLFDPEKGIAAGTLLLSRYLKAYGTTQRALGRYYGGSPSVYMSRINKKLDRLKRFTASRL